jgi:tyrosinase
MATMMAVLPKKQLSAKTLSVLSVNGAPSLTLRKSVYDLTPDEIAQFRSAIQGLSAIRDNRGFQYIAGIHGYPQQYCHKIDRLFAVWHRPYVLMMEQALQSQTAGFALPYWDWTSDQAQAEGIPRIFSEATWINPASGTAEPNPLLSQPILKAGTIPTYTKTSRDSGPPSGLAGLVAPVRNAQRDTNYLDYTADLENPHNGLHGWVSGTMGYVAWAAFDPLFWVHHANVERLFCEWQDTNPSVQPPPDVASAPLAPFNVTVADIWNYVKLGYGYLPPQTTVLSLSEGKSALAPTVRSGTSVAKFALSRVPLDFRRAELHFHEVEPPVDSFELRVFINEPNADAHTPTVNNPHYAGSYWFFGHGKCIGDDHSHCDVSEPETFPVRGPHHLTPINVRINVSSSVRAMLAEQHDQAQVTLVAVDNKGEQIDEPGLTFDALRLDAE